MYSSTLKHTAKYEFSYSNLYNKQAQNNFAFMCCKNTMQKCVFGTRFILIMSKYYDYHIKQRKYNFRMFSVFSTDKNMSSLLDNAKSLICLIGAFTQSSYRGLKLHPPQFFF